MSQSKLPLTLAEVLSAELKEQRLPAETDPVDRQVQAALANASTWVEREAASDNIVPTVYQAIHGLNEKRSALCLSGGGVRSATFNLGVLQGLARCGLLGKFDYLSTVSGGGFIGSWLTAWIQREQEKHETAVACENKKSGQNPAPEPGHGLKAVIDELRKQPPDSPLVPEPKPVYNLRVYSNYLTPRKGLLSADTWTLIAIYFRNLLLNWFVFLPVIMALLLLPRIWLAFVKSSYLGPDACLAIGFVSGVIALSYITLGLPSSNALNRGEGLFLWSCLLPLVVTAMALTSYWARLSQKAVPTIRGFLWFGVGLSALPVLLIIGAHIRAAIRQRQAQPTAEWPLMRNLRDNLVALLLIFVAFITTSVLTWCIVTNLFPPPLDLALSHGRLYAALAVPAMLLLLGGGGTLIAGFTSHFTDVEDQEWWARCGAWILIVAAGWSVVHLLVLFGPHLFVEVQALLLKQTWSWASLKGIGAGLVGIVSGAISLFGGFSSKTPAHSSEETGEQARPSIFVSAALPVSATVFAGFIVLCLAQLTNWLLASGVGGLLNTILNWILRSSHWSFLIRMFGLSSPFSLDLSQPTDFLYHTPGRVLVAMAIVIAALGALMGRMINTNRFSLHYYWRNRMMRSYLGASRNEEQREQTRNRFTDFDNLDTPRMYQLKQKPLHVVNVTLNLAGGKKLEWQDRKAESFTMSPLHCGGFWLGYRKSEEYARNRNGEGISLATAAAISGAAASPNMGYMMTSPVVRFIMTLFNVRMGFWFGNPGPDCGETYTRDSPRESVRPIVEEALGMTDDEKPYVYLSDGGHFENLGLYEMILRRCRFIVVSDASTDTKYAYDSLAMAIRQIRVDFGVPIDMGDMKFNSHPDAANNYCAVGLIRYSCVDKPKGSNEPDSNYDGVLVYIKPSLIGDEPRDVLNYHATSPTFPEETIADQWFSESQFESYRMLGSHMIEKICTEAKSRGRDKPNNVLLGSAKISSAAEAILEELNIEGWIEKLSPTPDSESGTSDLERHIEAVISALKASQSPACADFGDFADKAQHHVGRARELPSKDS
ncbi:MAG TPA: patatin-like phospholipase family protein [Pyrinomonadaceae bacterium]|nr:patatin-like phospholipase family protein [Pyrinomonadaceae bacterium]